MANINKLDRFNFQESVSLTSDVTAVSPGPNGVTSLNGATTDHYGYRIDWRYDIDTHTAFGHGTHTHTNGSDIITHDTSYNFPKKGQSIAGTGIPSNAKVIKKIDSKTFQMDKDATSSGTATDLTNGDPDPSDVETTFHIDVTNCNSIHVYLATTFLINFANYEKDCAKIFSGGAGVSYDTYETGSQDGDMPFTGGMPHRILVPKGLGGSKIFFNLLPYRNHYHHGNFCLFWSEQGVVE